MNTSDRLWKHGLGAAIAVVIGAPLAWMVVDRTPPLEFLGGAVFPPHLAPGSAMYVEWDVVRNRYCEGEAFRRVIDGNGVIHPYVSFSINPAIRDGDDVPAQETIAVSAFQLPAYASPGTASYSVTIIYVCNPLQQWWPIIVESPDVEFTITPIPEAPTVPTFIDPEEGGASSTTPRMQEIIRSSDHALHYIQEYVR